MNIHTRLAVRVTIVASLLFSSTTTHGAKLSLQLGNAQGVKMVGAIHRWDSDGNHVKLPDQAAKIDSPRVDATAVSQGNGRWVFQNLPKGVYDLVILADGRRRIEGFQFVPVREFDPFFTAKMTLDDETREFIIDDIKKSPQYENVVEPLYMAGNQKQTRVLMMLLRNKPTTYEDVHNAATMRHEIWQYSWNYGGWQKDKRSKVIDRIMISNDELRKWTWLWDSKLGGIEVGSTPITIKYELPKPSGERKLQGLYPY